MKKSLIALAVLATAGFASAQSSVTVFGVVDTGFQRVEREAAGSDVTTNRLASGLNRTSRLGFRGVEDLGGGLKANFWLEMGIATDSGASASTTVFTNNQTGSNVGGGGLVFNRRATVGLAGGFGEVRLGRDSVVGLLTQESFDPFDGNGVGSLRQVVYANVAAVSTGISSVRASNMINYSSPNLAGFTADVGYAFNENASNAGVTKENGRLVTARINYTIGKFNAKLGGTQIEYAAVSPTTGDYQEYTVGASYDFGIIKPALAFHSNKIKSNPTENRTDVIIVSLTAPVGPGLIRAAYTRADQKSGGNNDGSMFAIGYIYNLSKRTSLYTTYALSDNKNGSTLYQVGGSPGAAVANGRTTGLDIGVTHAF